MRKYISGRRNSFGYAFKGLKTIWVTQPNAKIHFIAAIIVVAAGIYYKLNKTEWLFMSTAIALVWITEAFNTALEFLTDLVSPEYHPLAGRAKDCAAAAVLIAAFFAVLVAGIVFGGKILGW